MTSITLLEKLAERCEDAPDAPAIMDANGRGLSRRQLLEKIRVTSRGFTAAGLQPGERVLFAVRPDVAAVVLMIAIVEAGGVLVPLDSVTGPALFRSRMALLSPRWVVAESLLFSASANPWVRRFLAWRGIKLQPFAEVENVRYVRVGRKWPGVPSSQSSTTLEKLGEQSCTAAGPNISDKNAVMIVFTSGTTGIPKAVVHSRSSMQGVFDTVSSMLDIGGSDHIYARELHLILPALFAGSSVVVPARSAFSAERTLRDLKKFQVTHFFGVAAEFQQLVDHLHSRNQKLPPSLREIWIGAAPVHAVFLERLETVLASGTKVWCVYGMTEILPVARVSLEEKVRYEGEGDLVGECVPGVSAGISAKGELLVRGANLFSGYFGEAPCTELATGDLARLNKNRVVLLGRRKDMIIRRHFNIYPELYESTIERIDGVQRCAMVGLYDEEIADERVVLAVESRRGVDGATLNERLW
ncbi:MAG: class I adenylate-forming enzyme family protein, partial [Gammaproteobacteria bacterium]|nr:class I adenylate-forming enzyme family protein [Gammaproteobacteria bacterium]